MTENNFEPGDIFHFTNYLFTDTKEERRHYALMLLPPKLFIANAHFCVITSKTPKAGRRLYLQLFRTTYNFFSEDVSYTYFNKVDLERIDEVGVKKKGSLVLEDFKKGMKLIYICIGIHNVCYKDPFFCSAVVRAWLQKKRELAQMATIPS
jgi:hypothetical protein